MNDYEIVLLGIGHSQETNRNQHFSDRNQTETNIFFRITFSELFVILQAEHNKGMYGPNIWAVKLRFK